jgi:mannitol-specific phosphotransferase system IIBC component
VCFNQYILPFVIIFGIIVVFLVVFVVSLVVYKMKMRKQKKLKAEAAVNKMNGKNNGVTLKGKGLEDLANGNIGIEEGDSDRNSVLGPRGGTPIKTEDD